MTSTSGRVRLVARAALLSAAAYACSGGAAEPLAEVIVEAARVAPAGGRSQPLGAPIDLASIRYRVSYADLDLATAAGARMLAERINDAAERACRQIEASVPPNTVAVTDDPPCVRTAVAGAMKQARAAIAAAGGKASK